MNERQSGPEAALFPFCSELRSKKLCFAENPPRTEADILDASRSVWCGRTMQVLGPDGELVRARECRAGRACYQPVL